MNLSNWQANMIRIVRGGNGVLGSAMTATQRAECDELVRAGWLQLAVAQNGNRFGVYRRPTFGAAT